MTPAVRRGGLAPFLHLQTSESSFVRSCDRHSPRPRDWTFSQVLGVGTWTCWGHRSGHWGGMSLEPEEPWLVAAPRLGSSSPCDRVACQSSPPGSARPGPAHMG